jgi:hypothetical protein
MSETFTYCHIAAFLFLSTRIHKNFVSAVAAFCKTIDHIESQVEFFASIFIYKGKSVPLQAWSGPEGSRKLRFPDYMTTAQDGGKLSALGTGRLYPRKYSWYLFLLEAESTIGAIVRSKRFYVNEKFQ